ncbi:hypothetical protein [Cyclobacterium amurskyense]|uniref:Uncharacterized protein n=1 Tax=Cyclobacterium amurskyense TaxID=320787 RepID=A0A0H4PR67_9BACT|nr:hypothetical protein [Cyclobacterium amurskyense]AKP50772.1 hypothetical protein CA2015_1325 [Cyclobacterium amurskyense]|tara:strand:+ start:5162 stop:5515 length:354 start_codon:yes stop_codon:yes gene_type:complete
MDLNLFRQLRENYEKFIFNAEKGINGDKAKEQTRSIFFDRKTIEELLAKTDDKEGGLKIYLGMYDKETVKVRGEKEDTEDYIGKLTLILAASNDNSSTTDDSWIRNGGKICPPDCKK